MAQDHTAATPAPGLVFVTGASRSGTTVLSRILGNARGAASLNELHFFGSLVPFKRCKVPMPRRRAERVVAMALARHHRDFWVSGPNPEERDSAKRIVGRIPPTEATGDRLFAETMDEIRRLTGAAVLCEQTPRNIYYAFHLLDAFPEAHVVHLVRDPRAVLASQKRRYKMRELGGNNVPVSEVVRLWLNYHPATMVRLWLSATREALAIASHPRVRIVRYEDLVGAPEATVRGLCTDLNLTYDAAMLEVPHWGSSTVQHRASSGLSAAALDKWREILDGAEIDYCSRKTRIEREHFGYPEAETPVPRLTERALFLARFPVHLVGMVVANPVRAAVQLKAMFARTRA
jgi:hypothetical protein